MSRTAPLSMAYSTEEFLSGRTVELADAAVKEVFDTMLGLTAEMVEATSTTNSGERARGEDRDLWATVRFGGQMHGACEVRMNPPAAGFLASLLLGMPIAEDDESIGDAVGELCNIIGGGWKNRAFVLSSRCSLSPPTILSGPGDLLGSPAAHHTRTYAFDGHTLRVTLTQEEVV